MGSEIAAGRYSISQPPVRRGNRASFRFYLNTKFGAEVRKHEAALKAWQEDEIPRARRESGLLAAEEAQDDADGIRLSIRDEKLIPTRARTLEGLIFKARYAASHFKEDYDEEVMRSIVDDLLAIAAGEEART